MNAIHDIPETYGSHSQHLYRALTSCFSNKYNFLYSVEKTWRVFKAFTCNGNAFFLPFFSAEYKLVKNLYLKKKLVRERSRSWLWDPFVSGISWIALIVKYFLKKVLFRKYGQKCGRLVSTWSWISISFVLFISWQWSVRRSSSNSCLRIKQCGYIMQLNFCLQ